MYFREDWSCNNKEDYLFIVQNTPLVSVDVLIVNDGRYLVGKRNNKPAQGYYFVPGARVFKNEPIEEAVCRVLKSECNIVLDQGVSAKCFGVYEHYYPVFT